MSERRFYFRELAEYEYQSTMIKQQYTITESELKRRLKEIIDADHPIDNCIDILLHGEGKEEPIPRPDEWPHVPFPKKPQPDPWEAWKADAPNPNNYNRWENWAIDSTNWLREMPRGK